MITPQFNQKYFGPGCIALMVAGILFLCQPWVQFLHAWSVLVMLVGLIGFNVSVHIPAPEPKVDEDYADPASVAQTVTMGGGHD